MPTTLQLKRVAVLMDRAFGSNREILRGIQSWNATESDWTIHHAVSAPHVLPALREWQPDGVIAHVTDPELAEGLEAWGGPVVNTTSTLNDAGFPLVEVDHQETGRLAAHHFIDRGHLDFAFFGSSMTGFSLEREQGFREVIEEHGATLHVCHADQTLTRTRQESWIRNEEEIERWLLDLPRPCAVFVSNDVPARIVTTACEHLGLKVPEEFSILSVDNDEFECLFAHPTLSSIEIPSERIGREAARTLRALMRGEQPLHDRNYLPPVQIIERESTDLVATPDQAIQAAVAFIRARHPDPISVEDVAKSAHCSRRTLERKFRQSLDRTIHEELARQRLAHARRLLAETDADLETIAQRAGFTDARRLAVVFRQHFDSSPSSFRRTIR
ncbi:MAG: XylR family transcriptional regulator [Phycisphaerales bacterium]|nr:XylR family transcriptional regulator [Phycisphaerales bacterium]